ncbi:MAG: site-specific DNA-methyltransferase [Victivallales bacterium]
MAIDRKALASRIRELHDLSADEKSMLLELLNTRKKYGLVWEDKPEKVEDELREKLPVLKEVTKRRILSKESGVPNHIIIEGDNLHALTTLQYTHAGKIDVIYIDPPYNTGNKDFIYNDSFVDKEDAWRHSKWLSFMSKRLKLAKLLLKETGVIFISIDDNEQAQLKLLFDEVFREDNFVVNIIVQSNKRGQTYKDIAKTHEYLLCYTKSPTTGLSPVEKEDNGFNFKDDIGEFSIRELRNRNPKFGKFNRPNLFFPFYISKTKFDENEFHLVSLSKSTEFSIETIPLNSEGTESCWRWSKQLVNKCNTGVLSTTPVIAKKKRDGGWNVYEKYRKTTERVKSIWEETEVINEQGSMELREMGLKGFDHPKPIHLIRKCLTIGATSNAIILDFFAGSGTTLHAAMALNAEDDGNRRCILVTNNENNICEEVTCERNKRVIRGYINSKSESVAGLTKNNLRYYQVGFVERSQSMKNRKELTYCSVDLLCIRENCYEPLKGFDGKDKDIRVFGGGEFTMFVIFDPLKIELAVSMIKKLPGHCKVYVFSPGHYAFDDEFEEVSEKIELCALPEAILQAYDKVLPKAKQKLIAGVEKGALGE